MMYSIPWKFYNVQHTFITYLVGATWCPAHNLISVYLVGATWCPAYLDICIFSWSYVMYSIPWYLQPVMRLRVYLEEKRKDYHLLARYLKFYLKYAFKRALHRPPPYPPSNNDFSFYVLLSKPSFFPRTSKNSFSLWVMTGWST